MPTGLTNTPGIIAAGTTQGVPITPRSALNNSVRMIFTSATVPQVCPAVVVPTGCNVYVRAHNGTTAGNTTVARVATSPEVLISGVTQGDVITPDTEISFPVDNLGQIWGIGAIYDGLIISIRANSR